MEPYLSTLALSLPLELPLVPGEVKENSSIHVKRYNGLLNLPSDPLVPIWLILNRLLEKKGIDPVFSEYHRETEFILPVDLREPIESQVETILGALKGRQMIYTEPKMEAEGAGYKIRRKAGPVFYITKTDYDQLKDSMKNIPSPNRLGLIYNLYARYEPLNLPFSYLESYYELLKSSYGVDLHFISTPTKHIYPDYGSLYPDVDRPFGSLGNFFYNDAIIERINKGGNFELTALFLKQYAEPLLFRLEEVLKKVKNPTTVIVLLEGGYARESLEGLLVEGHRLPSSNHTILVYRSNGSIKGGRVKDFDPEPILKYFEKIDPVEKKEEVEIEGLKLKYPSPSLFHTLPYLTVYEKAVAIGSRAGQYVRGGVTEIDVGEEHDLLTIAEMELKAKKMPITIRRSFPNGEYEDYQINTLVDLNY